MKPCTFDASRSSTSITAMLLLSALATNNVPDSSASAFGVEPTGAMRCIAVAITSIGLMVFESITYTEFSFEHATNRRPSLLRAMLLGLLPTRATAHAGGCSCCSLDRKQWCW